MDESINPLIGPTRRHHDAQWYQENLPWKAWGSWFSWGSPVGLGLFFVLIGAFLWLLAQAGLIR